MVSVRQACLSSASSSAATLVEASTSTSGDPCLAAGGACAFPTNSGNCASGDVRCGCRVIAAAGSQISTCVTCKQAINATLAQEIQALSQKFGTITLGTSELSPIATGDSCISGACCWLRPISSCPSRDVVCFCRVYGAAGAVQVASCVGCEQSFNRTFASEIAQIGSECATVTPTQTGSLGGILS